MNALNLDYFLPPIEDKELNQYRILAQLKDYSQQFHKNKLYPSLSHLHQIDNLLNSLYVKYQQFNAALFEGFTAADANPKETAFDDESEGNENTDAYEMIKWAQPLVRKVMDEGLAIYEFTYDNIYIEPIEPVPSFNEEGYFIVPNYRDSELLLVEYVSSIFTSNKKPVRSLKTKLVHKISLHNKYVSISKMGLSMVELYGDMINPAVYVCRTELDFPFEETVFPIAKSKLLSLITS